VVLHPSSGSPKKNPPIELFFEIENFLTGLGYQCVYLVGEADQWLKAHVKNFVEMSPAFADRQSFEVCPVFCG
jgi:hypothetical protein